MKLNLKIILILSVSALALLLLVPWRTVAIAPAVQVHILDEAGSPASGVTVTQEWEYQAVGSDEHKEVQKADVQGYVAFPARADRISLGRQGLSIVREIIHMPHGYGIGPYVRVSAYGDDPSVWTFQYCMPSYPKLEVMRLKRWDVTMYP
jgi:hypothetical protein